MSTDELSTLNDADVIKLHIQCRDWGKDLRQGVAALVDSRMANQISYEEYTASRKAAKDDRDECERMIAALSTEMRRRSIVRKQVWSLV